MQKKGKNKTKPKKPHTKTHESLPGCVAELWMFSSPTDTDWLHRSPENLDQGNRSHTELPWMVTLKQKKCLILILKKTVTKLQRKQDFRESSTGANITKDIKWIFNELVLDQSSSCHQWYTLCNTQWYTQWFRCPTAVMAPREITNLMCFIMTNIKSFIRERSNCTVCWELHNYQLFCS